ncbi:MAG: sugar-binding domain-containing protein, partial [Proteiniphilum sp.]
MQMKLPAYFIWTVCFFLPFSGIKAQQVFSLDGEWSVQLDPDSTGVEKKFFEKIFANPIILPGTLDEAGYGTKTTGSDYGILTRKYKYIGPAWYNREIVIPKSWQGKDVVLHLERVMWQSQVWIDGKPVGVQEGLGTPHYHNLGKLSPGKHLLSVRVNNDMIYNIGDKGHSYGEYTQIIWNGMIGKIELIPQEKISIHNLHTWPDVANNQLSVTFNARSETGRSNGTVGYTLIDNQTGETVASFEETLSANEPTFSHRKTLSLDMPVKRWDEFSPNLYTLKVVWRQGRLREEKRAVFGFRDISVAKSKIVVNGESVFMRGNLDCLHFPLTGYPSCDESEWERIFRIYKSYGLNHVRFHSWCPPQAAFAAADKVGVYIQAEVLWIDWWMSVINPDRPEMTTKGLPKGLGHNPSADEFVPAELERMLEAYGNHPSFVMMCIGNELGNSDFEVMEKWIEPLREKDNRRLYSVSTARKIMPVDQYMATHNIPNVGGTYGLRGNGTDFDLEENYAKADIPILAHEVGQYPVYPLWSEINKYTGVLEARNLSELLELAQKNHIAHLDKPFHDASGALQTILYKALIETFYRTSSCAGFQMLSMTDYSGQGEALVGWLDSFWDSKGIVTPGKFS